MQASLHSVALIHLMLGLGTPFFSAERVKANFVVPSVQGVISETSFFKALSPALYFHLQNLKTLVLQWSHTKNVGLL